MPRRVRRTKEEKLAKQLRRYHHRRHIKSHYVHTDKYNGDYVHPGDEALKIWLNSLEEPSNVFVASTARHLRQVEERGHRVIWHLEQQPELDDVLLGKLPRMPDASGPLSRLKFDVPVSGAFVCERIQKQPNLANYLISLRQLVKPQGVITLVVPNVHHELVDDHINLFTAGTLAYNLVRCGWNLADAAVEFDGRFINVHCSRTDLPLPWPTRVDQIAPYVPFKNIFQYCTGEIADVYRERPEEGAW